VLIIFKRDPQRHRRNLVSIQKEIGVQKLLQTVQMEAPAENREIHKKKLDRNFECFGAKIE
jgi:hypothetical protein